MYHGPWYHGLALFSSNPFLVFSATWLFEVVLACFILWICVCRASVFGRSHLFFSDNAATRLGCTQTRVGTVGALAQRQYIMWIYTVIYNVYTIQYSGALPQRNEQWRQKRGRLMQCEDKKNIINKILVCIVCISNTHYALYQITHPYPMLRLNFILNQKGLAFMGPRKLNKEEKSEESLMSSSLLPFFL